MEKLINGKFYHIYNRGNNSENLFREPRNYQHFLDLYDRYIRPVAETYAWCLMPNHFHLLVRIRENIVYKYSYEVKSIDPDLFEEYKWETMEMSSCVKSDDLSAEHKSTKIPQPHLHFSHFFNAYAKYINTLYGRTGNLFQRQFKRIEVTYDNYYRQLVTYIHNNPVHHGFTDDFKDYPWTSYRTIMSPELNKPELNKVLGWFEGKENFVKVHDNKFEYNLIKDPFME